MGMFDEALTKTKEVFDAACQKGGEIISTQKQKYAIASLKSKREKDFAYLGKLYYAIIEDNDDLDDETRTLVDAINAKSEEISRLYEEIKDIENKAICPNCAAKISADSVYCNSCGIKVKAD